jgi:sugar lactone lactonase YvrE
MGDAQMRRLRQDHKRNCIPPSPDRAYRSSALSLGPASRHEAHERAAIALVSHAATAGARPHCFEWALTGARGRPTLRGECRMPGVVCKERRMDFDPVVTGFCLIEAPRWDERGLWFTDILLGGVRCLRADGRVDQWLLERDIIGGMVMNDDGRLILSGTGGLVWLDPDTGKSGVLLDRIDGQPISGVNDMVPDGRGGLWFGWVDHLRMRKGEDFFGTSALYHLDPAGKVTRHFGGVGFSNGIGLSPTGDRLYFTDSAAGVHDFAVREDGTLGEPVLRGEPGGDGLVVDSEGAVWTAAIQAGTVNRMLPDGTFDRRLPVPGGHPVSLTFGGADLQDLYVSTAAPDAGMAAVGRIPKEQVPRTATIFRARSEVAGQPMHKTAFR